MKSIATITTVAFLLQSCITIKVYQSEAAETNQAAPKATIKKMLPMGKTIHLDGTDHELQFFGADDKHFEVFAGQAGDSIQVKKIHIITDKKHDSMPNHWVSKGEKTKIMVFRTDTGDTDKDPLIIIDGVRMDKGHALDEMQPDQIETINVLKGEAATKKYGPEAANGVVEITTKKD